MMRMSPSRELATSHRKGNFAHETFNAPVEPHVAPYLAVDRVKPNDIVVAETGTPSMGLAFCSDA